MSESKRRKITTRRSYTRGRMKDWKTNWQDILRNTNSTNREKGYMKSNAGKGAYEGVWKKGDEVVYITLKIVQILLDILVIIVIMKMLKNNKNK